MVASRSKGEVSISKRFIIGFNEDLLKGANGQAGD